MATGSCCRRRRRADADVGAPRHGRTRSTAFEGMVIDPVFQAARRSRAAPATVVGPPRRRAAGHRRADPAVVEAAHLSASHKSLFLWFFAMLDRAPSCCCGSPSGCGAGTHSTRAAVLLAVALVSVGDRSPRPCSAPTRPTCRGSRASRSRSASVAVVEVVRPASDRDRRAGRGHDRRHRRPRLTFVVTSLFTFRYYLLHTRVGLGQVPSAVPGRARRPPLLPRRLPGRTSRSRDAIDDLDRLAEAR